MDGKPFLKGAWLNYVNHLHFGAHQPYLSNGLSFQVKYPAKP